MTGSASMDINKFDRKRWLFTLCDIAIGSGATIMLNMLNNNQPIDGKVIVAGMISAAINLLRRRLSDNTGMPDQIIPSNLTGTTEA